MAIERPYPVLDESGKVQTWLDAGRGLRVWVSHDIGANRPDMLTPGDNTISPHWAYPLHASEVLTAAEVLFYRRVQVVRSWHDTPQGNRAARAYMKKTWVSGEDTRQAPIGEVRTRYTLERFTLESNVKVHMPGSAGRPPVIPATEGYDRPLHTEYRIGVVSWVCIIPSEVPYAERKEA